MQDWTKDARAPNSQPIQTVPPIVRNSPGRIPAARVKKIHFIKTALQNVISMQAKIRGAPARNSRYIPIVWIVTDSEEKIQDAHAKRTPFTEIVHPHVSSMPGRMKDARVRCTRYTRTALRIVTCMQGKTQDVRATSFLFTKIVRQTVKYSLDKTHDVRVNKIHSILIVQQIVKSSLVKIPGAHAARTP
jgi:hypothetical protein